MSDETRPKSKLGGYVYMGIWLTLIIVLIILMSTANALMPTPAPTPESTTIIPTPLTRINGLAILSHQVYAPQSCSDGNVTMRTDEMIFIAISLANRTGMYMYPMARITLERLSPTPTPCHRAKKEPYPKVAVGMVVGDVGTRDYPMQIGPAPDQEELNIEFELYTEGSYVAKVVIDGGGGLVSLPPVFFEVTAAS